MANPTITINATGITVSGPLIAGEPLAVTASGLSLLEGAALTLALSSRAPNALLASCVLAESEETPGTWTGTLETASRQMAVYFATAAADDTRPAVLELVETTTRDSLALLVTSIRNSALIPSSSPCAVAPVYLPIPGPPGDPQPSDAYPLMDCAASPGISADYSRSDHQHPTDTSRMAATATGVDIIVQPTGQWGGAPIATFAAIITARVNDKQDSIEDLAAIRSGAAAGATAVQPAALSAYRPASAQDAIDDVQTERIGVVERGVDALDRAVQTIGGMIPSTASSSNKLTTAADLSGKQDTITDLATIRSGAAAGATAYQKPASGIPAGDLTIGVKASLDKADTAVQPASPDFTGTPTAPTAPAGTNTTQIATTAFVQDAVRYSFASPTPSVSGTSATVACEDRAINDFTVATGITSLTITPPAAVTGRARDFFCRVTLTDSSLPTVTLSGATIDIGATEVAGMTQGVNVLMFTEIASGHWLASRRSAS